MLSFALALVPSFPLLALFACRVLDQGARSAKDTSRHADRDGSPPDAWYSGADGERRFSLLSEISWRN